MDFSDNETNFAPAHLSLLHPVACILDRKWAPKIVALLTPLFCLRAGSESIGSARIQAGSWSGIDRAAARADPTSALMRWAADRVDY
jgi:hypothetical protein